MEILHQWNIPATSNRKWDNLVKKGLDAYDQLRKESPEQIESAGWLLALVSHLARDHYDVAIETIKEVLGSVEQFPQVPARGTSAQVLEAKLSFERFLLRRRAEQWGAEVPAVEHLTRYESTHNLWYLAEGALVAAGASDEPAQSDLLLGKCQAALEAIRVKDAALADGLQKRVDRYEATRQPFDAWLSVAMGQDYRDRRGTVLPEVTIETRPQLVERVRRGFENKIAQQIQEGDVDAAFQSAQKAKALSVGRVIRPAMTTELIASKLMSQGVGGQMQIPRQELFVEYYVGPKRAWMFYVFAGGDAFSPMQVVEMNRALLLEKCVGAIRSIRAGAPTEDAGKWILGETLSPEQFWQQLSDLKRSNPRLRRVVVAPDGPLCYLPLQVSGAISASAVTYVPTAGVLVDSGAIEPRDVQLMWEIQQGDFVDSPPVVRREKGEVVISLWRGVMIPILLQDNAEPTR